MYNKWTALHQDYLPTPNALVWCKRTGGNIYLAKRNSEKLSTHPDPSRNTHWDGVPYEEKMICQGYEGFDFNSSFSDVTVAWWQYVVPPAGPK